MNGQAQKKGESVSGYFRQVFSDHPEWLKETSNDAILAQYRKDHGIADDASVDPKIRNNLANIKSVVRKKKRMGAYAGRKRRKLQRKASKVGTPITRLEHLEEQIDECMTLAKSLGRESLDSVIRNLRRARYEVVWKMGQS